MASTSELKKMTLEKKLENAILIFLLLLLLLSVLLFLLLLLLLLVLVLLLLLLLLLLPYDRLDCDVRRRKILS